MPEFPPDITDSDVVAVSSRRVDEERRSFSYDREPDGDGPALPELEGIEQEDELVEAFRERGYRLTMVGGGAGSGDVRRFYFRAR